MKHLGRIEIGGSLDITNNKHVEELLEEALKGIDIPEDTNTTYTLTQDGLTVQLVDDLGNAVSEIEIPKLEDKNTTYTLSKDGTTIQLEGSEGGSSEVDIASLIPQPVDPYQEEKEFIIRPEEAVNLFDTLRSGDYDEFDITSEFDAENNLISIYLHLHIGVDIETFTLADNVSNEWFYYTRAGAPSKVIRLTEVYKDGDYLNWDVGNSTRVRHLAQISPVVDTPLEGFDGGLTIYSDTRNGIYFVFPNITEETVSGQQVFTGTLEDHLQNIYGHIYNS